MWTNPSKNIQDKKKTCCFTQSPPIRGPHLVDSQLGTSVSLCPLKNYHRIVESLELEGTFKGHLVQLA